MELVETLAGIQAKDGGVIRVNGQETDFRTPAGARAAGIAVVYQELSLVPDMSVADNIFLSREPKRFGLVDRARILGGGARVPGEPWISARTESHCSVSSIRFSPTHGNCQGAAR